MNRDRARPHRVGRLLATLPFILPLLAALLTVAPVVVSAAKDGSGTVEGHTVTGTRSATPPALSAEDQARLDAAKTQIAPPVPMVPEGPGAKHLTTKPAIPPIADPPTNPPATTTTTNTPSGVGKQSASDFSIFQNNPLNATGPLQSAVSSPSVAVHGNVVFETAAFYAALSTDRGTTWSFINPATFFPTMYGGFGGNQEIIYDVNRDVWVWELEYVKDSSGNAIRFATATTAQMVANTMVWKYYDFSAFDAGQLHGEFFSDPNVSLSNNSFYYTGNLYTNAGVRTGQSIAMRISLAALHAEGSSVLFEFHADNFAMVPTQGASTTMYLLAHIDTTTIYVLAWSEASFKPNAPVPVPHASYSTAAHTCTAPDSRNPCSYDDNNIKAAWVANGVIGALWDVGEGGGGLGTFAYPYIQGVRINQSTLGFINDVAMYAANVALGWPSVGVNGRGGLGTVFMFCGNAYYPGTAVMISDDFDNYAFPGDIRYPGYGNGGGAAYGKFLTARAADEYGNSWVGAAYTIHTATPTFDVRYLRWGRERDDPFFAPQPLSAIWRSSDASWHLRNSFTGGPNGDYNFTYGGTDDVPLMCNWKGDGQKYPTVYHKSTSQFVFSGSISNPGASTLAYTNFGAPTDIPICGDWTGQGRDTVGVYRPGTATFYLDNSNTAPNPNGDIVRAYGNPGDVPVVGDWNGDGKTKIGIFHPNIAQFVLSSSNATPNFVYQLYFGTNGDMPIVGDWDRTGYQKVGVDRNGSWQWRNTLTTGYPDGSFIFGTTGDTGLVWR